MLLINDLSASDYVLIPVQTEYFAAEDMTELIGTVQSIKRQIHPKLNVGGVFMTMANDTNFRKDIITSAKATYHLPTQTKTVKEANYLIDRYIHFYSHDRIQNKTGVAPLTLRHSAKT